MNAARFMWYGIPALLLLTVGVATEIRLPGVYMDAINPDFLVTGILNPRAQNLTGTLPPGQLIAGTFPVLPQVYYGPLTVYMGLPFYALFGTDVVGIRLVHGVFAGIVLVSFFVLLLSFRVRLWLAALAAAALALEPALLFSFRTQFCVTTLPIAFVFLSAAAVNWAAAARDGGEASARVAVSGLLAGIAGFGYFVHIFFAPVIFAFALAAHVPLGRRHRAMLWIAGLLVGLSPYVLGYALLAVSFGSPSAALDYVHNLLAQLKIERAHETLAQRLDYARTMFAWAALNTGTTTMMFQDLRHSVLGQSGETWRLAIVFGLPLAALGLSEALRRGSAVLRLAAGFVTAGLIMVLIFGSRLWVQHVAPLVPVFYLGIAGSSALLLRQRYRRIAVLAAAVPLVALICLNLRDRGTVIQALRQTGGVGLFSDAINHYADDTVLAARHTFYIFPDWGLHLPVLMATRGEATVRWDLNVNEARRELCAGKDVVLAYFPKGDDARRAAWIKSMDRGEPEEVPYRQRNGVEVLRSLRWRSSAKCGN
jgi:hypothetical protein